ncbi:protein-L-isoaspartate(D-aspartate) O-methyltransferase [Candidatus Woesearchaeota archaeon]|nr:protein-L-isoaspartate(D-aspartate) O-methyltransferase [Candidatus Woesearchaeota archaeon]
MVSKKALLLEELRCQGIAEKVMRAVESVDRELFVSPDLVHLAYENIPLPIGSEQTISQPYTVAFMIQLLDIQPGDKILEVGAGSGYNAAVMSQLVGDKGEIFSLEIVEELVRQAKSNLKKAGIRSVQVIHANGYNGYVKEAPFDKIIVTAGAPEIPPPLVEQLKEGGIMVIPRTRFGSEVMMRVIKRKEKLEISEHGAFSFVPLKYK